MTIIDGCSSRTRKSEDEGEGRFRPWPKVADQLLAASTDQAAEYERDDDRVIELPRDRDEVGD
jgi:hypothetical protein